MRDAREMPVGTAPPDIALFLPDLLGGGAERVMVTLASGFARRGWRVELVVGGQGEMYGDELDHRVSLVRLGTGRAMASLGPLVAYLVKSRPGVLLSTMNYANVVAIGAVRLARALSPIPTRVFAREADTVSVSTRHNPSPRARWVLRAMRLAYPGADAIVAPSQGVARDLAKATGLLPANIRVIANPVHDARVVARAGEAVAHPWFAEGQPPVVLGVGRLSQQKDFATLLQAFARLLKAQQARPLRLVLLGEGEERASLGALAQQLGVAEDVDLPGFVPNPFAYMARSAVFVLSSQWEGLPNVLIQAMATGTPLVATRCPSGPDEILEQGRWGALVPVGDPAEMARAMDEALRGPRHAVGAHPGLARYDVEAVVDSYLAAFGLPPHPGM